MNIIFDIYAVKLVKVRYININRQNKQMYIMLNEIKTSIR